MKYTSDVVVIGAGVLGASIALELARCGLDVIVLDKAGDIGHGSTSASSGVVRFHYSTFAGVALAWESAHAWRDWEGHLGYADPAGLASFSETGILVLDPHDGASTHITTLFDRVGVPWEFWDSNQIVRRLPHVDPGHFGPPAPVDSDAFFADARGALSGTFTPNAGHVADPQLAAHNLGAAAQHVGAHFRLRRTVDGAEMTGSRRWRVSTTEGDVFDSDVVVNAGGPWSSKLNDIAGVGDSFAVTSRPLRQEVHQVSAPEGFNAPDGAPGVAVADPDLGVYVRSAGAEGLLVGGMEPECDPLEWVTDPDGANPLPTAKVFEAQSLRAARRFPALAVPNRPKGLAGVYDVTPDWSPIYDKTDLPGFYVAMGTSGNQFKNAPVVGKLMSVLIDAVEGGLDHDTSPVQFRLTRTDHTVDLSIYSRRRSIDVNAPATVMG